MTIEPKSVKEQNSKVEVSDNPYCDLTQEEKERYKNYVSHWILHKYQICSCGD